MVTLNHQRFWQPLPRASVRRSSTGSETQTTDVVRQSDAPEERNEADYTLGCNVPQEERSTLSLEPGEPPRANSPELYLNDAASAAGNYPDYPEEVALYPSSRDTASVTGLEGPEIVIQTKGSELWNIQKHPLRNDAGTGLLRSQMRTSREEDEHINQEPEIRQAKSQRAIPRAILQA
ncbi:hypothetical protein DTO012A8_8618 [Penicillium roqueforti]|nr:hypothetical protein DTO012A8_8618 [Penicillium roqueforti]